MPLGGAGIFLDIIPKMNAAAMERAYAQATGAARAFGTNVETVVTSAATTTERQILAAQASVERSMAAMAAASDRVAITTAKLEAAQIKLNIAVAEYGVNSRQAATAQAQLEVAQVKATAAGRAQFETTQANVVATNELAAAQGRLAETTAASGTAAAVGGAAYKTGAIALGAFAVAVGVSANKAADFQQSQMLLVSSAGESHDKLKEVSDGILDMAGKVGTSAMDLSRGMYTVESAGFRGADGLAVLKAAAQGAKAENADLKEVTNGLTTTLTDFGLKAEDANDVMSKMVVAVGHSKATFQEFSGALSTIEPLAGAAGLSIADVYGSLAQMTQSGMSAQQSTEYLRNALVNLQRPSQQTRDMMGQYGINAQDVAEKLGQRGLAGTMQYLSDTVRQHMGPSGQIVIDTMYKNELAASSAKKIFDALPPAAQKVAQAIKDGTISYKDWRKEGSGLTVEQRNQVNQWLQLNNKITGYATTLKQGKGDVQTYEQAMNLLTGTMSGASVAMQLTGEHADDVNALIAQLGGTVADADGDVKGWKETQETFNQKMSEFKSGMGALAIEIGNDFLPTLTKVVDHLSDFAKWMQDNKGWVDAFIISLGVAAGAFAVFKIASSVWAVMSIGIQAATWAMGLFATAEGGATVGATGLAAALAATGISEIVIGVTALIAGLIALGVGIKYAWDHWAWFHDSLTGTWNFMKSFGSWIAEAFSHAWDNVVHAWDNVWHAGENVKHAFDNVWHAGENVWHAAQNVGHAIGNVVHAVGNFVHAVGNTVHAIEVGLRYAGAIIATVIGVPIYAIAKLLMWWWHNVTEPAMKGIAAAFVWVYQYAIKPTGAAIMWAIDAVGKSFQLMYQKVFLPIGRALAAAWNWVYNNAIKPVGDAIMWVIHAVGESFVLMWQNVFKPAIDGISSGWNWLYNNVIRPVAGWMGDRIRDLGGVFTWLNDNVIQPVGNAISTAVNGIGTAFDKTVSWIKDRWEQIQKIVSVPAKFIIETVYNGAIVPVWNGIAGVFGLDKISKVEGTQWAASGGGVVPDGAVHAAGGTVLPGYAPGQDTVNAVLSPGEGVAVPELVKAIGPQNFMALNHYYSGGRKAAPGSPIPHFAPGGIMGDTDGSGDLSRAEFDALPEDEKKKIASGAISNGMEVVDKAKMIAEIAKDPVGWVRKQFEGKWGDIPGRVGQFGEFIGKIPGKVIDGAIEKVKSWFGAHPEAANAGGVIAAPAQVVEWIKQALAACGLPVTPGWINGMQTLIMRESGGNTRAINLDDENAAAGHPSKGLTQTIQSTFDGNHQPGTSNDIYDPVANIAASLNYVQRTYGVSPDGHDLAAKVQQANASAGPKGYSGGGIVPMYFAGGGVVPGDPAGVSQIDNSKSGPAVALQKLNENANTPYVWGGGSLGSGVDCSGLVANAQEASEGDFNWHRLGTTNSMLDGSWPGLIPGASPSDAFAIGVNPDHTAATILGTNIEARQSGENIRIGASAAGAFDAQFTKTFHVDPSRFRPPWDPNGPKTPDPAAIQNNGEGAGTTDDIKSNPDDYPSTGDPGLGTTGESTTGSGEQMMTFEQFGSKVGGIAASGLLETFGLNNTVLADPNQSAVLRVGHAISKAKLNKPRQDLLAKTNVTVKKQVFDDGGLIQPGLTLVDNKSRRPEPVLNFEGKRQLEAAAQGEGDGSGMKGMVVIEEQHVHGGDGKKVGRDIAREMNAKNKGGRR